VKIAGREAAGGVAWLGLLGAMAMGALVFWLFDAVPFQDLPAHAATFAMRHAYDGSMFLQRYFKLGSSLGPYSIFLWLGALLERAFGATRAARALSTLPGLCLPPALLFGRWRLHRDRSLWAGFLGVALSFGFMTALGLASYLLALTLLVVAFTIWLELLRKVERGEPAGKSELVFAGLATLVGLAHGFALTVLVVLSVATLAERTRLPLGRRVAALRVFVPATLPMVWSFERGGPPEGSSAPFVLVPSADFQSVLDKLSLLVTPTLLTKTGVDIAVGVAVWGVLLVATRATMRRDGRESSVTGDPSKPSPCAAAESARDASSRTHSRSIAAALAAAGVLFFALPHAYRWFGFIDGRMVPVLWILAILGIRRSRLGPRLTRALDIVAPLAAFSMTSIAWVASARFQAEAYGWRDVLAAVPPEATVLNLPLDPDSAIFTAHPFVHYDKLLATREPALPSDVWPDRGTGLYPTPDNPSLRLPSSYNSANLKRIDWQAYDLDDWTYVLVRVRPDAPPPDTPSRLALVVHAGGFWLYRTRPVARKNTETTNGNGKEDGEHPPALPVPPSLGDAGMHPRADDGLTRP
jgi:hypothetical protein